MQQEKRINISFGGKDNLSIALIRVTAVTPMSRLFKARRDPDNAPIVMTLGGGPGASGMLFPFSGAGFILIVLSTEYRTHTSQPQTVLNLRR